MIELNNDNHQEMKEGLVLVEFWSPAWVHCKELTPLVEELEKEYSNKIKFYSLNAKAQRRFAIGQGIKGLPNVSIYKDGKVVDSIIGLDVTKENVEEIIKKHI